MTPREGPHLLSASQLTSILVIHQGAIGDLIVSLPVLRTLRHTFPEAGVEMWGYPDTLRLVEKRFYADSIVSIDRREMVQCYREAAVLDAQMKSRLMAFDLIVVFGKVKNTFFHNIRNSGAQRVIHITTFPPPDGKTHVIDYQLSQLEELGVTAQDRTPAVFPGEGDCARATSLFKEKHLSRSFLTIAVHIGSGSAKKSWPPLSFARLTEKLDKEDGARIILPLGPADTDAARNFFSLISPDMVVPLENLPLSEVAAVLRRCDLYVGSDSGITHLAAAVGIPVVALFGPTHPRVWGPRGKRVTIVHAGRQCSPCSREELRMCGDQKCMESITLKEVYRKVRAQLDGSTPGVPPFSQPAH
jgi:ADP-heptose:LPS heptosyltransferase